MSVLGGSITAPYMGAAVYAVCATVLGEILSSWSADFSDSDSDRSDN